VQRGAAHQLDVEGPLSQGPLGGLAGRCEGLGEQFVEGFPVGVPLAELIGHAAQLGVAHLDEVVFDGVNLLADPLELAEEPSFAGAKDTIDDGWHFSSRSSRIV
jgi:hypothetical protein